MPTRRGINYHPKTAAENFDLAQAFKEFSVQLSDQIEA